MYRVMQSRLTLYSIAGVFSIFFSIWAALKTVVINPDGICYLLSAEALKQGLFAASHVCKQANWPFYSILIFGVTKITPLSFTGAAFLLNGFFSLISILTFIAIVNTITSKKRCVILGAIVILLAHQFNVLRVEIIRDHGFWALYLLSLFFMLQYFTHTPKKISYALLWSISLMIASLFRIEGVLFLLFAPVASLINMHQRIGERIKHFLQLNALTLAMGSVLCILILLHPEKTFGRLDEVQFHLMHGVSEILQSFHQTVLSLEKNVLNRYSAHDADWIALGMFLVWYLGSVVSNLSLVYAVLFIYAVWKKLTKFNDETLLVFWTYIFINVLITGIFLIDYMFLSERYLIALSLVLMLWIPFALDNLIEQWPIRKWPLLIAAFFVATFGISGIFDFGYSKKYIRESGDWLAIHASPQQKIYSNDFQLLYYSKHFGNAIFTQGPSFENLNTIANGKWRQYDFIALRLSQNEIEKNKTVLSEMKLTPVVVFKNHRNDQVRIYDLQAKNKLENIK